MSKFKVVTPKGASFTTAGGVWVSRIAAWNDSGWSALGSGMNGNVYALAVSGVKPVSPGVFSAMEVAASGLSAERSRMNVVAGNLANARTTRTAEGGPYKRLDPVFEAAH